MTPRPENFHHVSLATRDGDARRVALCCCGWHGYASELPDHLAAGAGQDDHGSHDDHCASVVT